MSTLIESLKRLYIAERITLVKLESMQLNGKITQEEFDYILGL